LRGSRVSYLVILFFSLLFFSSDFLLKKYLLANFIFNKPYPLIGDIVLLRLVYNRGAAFGILKGNTLFLIFIGLVFVIFFIIWIFKADFSLKEKIFLAMILGGALSNLYDRVFLGAVVDYIDLGFWPVFNLSDTFITLGCIFFIFRHLRINRWRKENL